MTNDTNIKVTTVTPELAEAWLGKNTHNRTLRENVVEKYARDMRAGNWKWNGESIKFSDTGVLTDGQHRLHAIIKANVPIEMLVIRGVEMDAQHTMDNGAKRTLGDALKLRGEKNSRDLAAGLSSCFIWDKGHRSFDGSKFKPTVTEALAYLEENPSIREYVSRSSALGNHVRIPASVSVLCMKIFFEIDYEDAEHFFERFASDEGHFKGEPFYALRKAFLETVQTNGIKKANRRADWKIAVTIKAWNKYRMGDEVRILTYRPGGANPERFPEPI